MNFATWSIRNPIPVIVLFIIFAIAGLWGFAKLPIQSMPDIDLPTITITASQPGAAPAQLESEVARKIEDSVATVAGIKHIRTSITDGQVSISAEFVLEKKISDALIETKNATDRVRSELPAELLEPTVSAVRVGNEALMTYAIAEPSLSEESLSWWIDDTLAKSILAVPGVGRFERFGGGQREVRIEVDPTELAAVGATAADVSRALHQSEQDLSGGRSQLGHGEQAIRTIGSVKEAGDLDRLPINLADGRQLRLDQVAVVKDTLAEPTQVALLDGRRVVGFNVYRATGGDEIRIAEGVAATLQRLVTDHPELKATLVSSRVAHTIEQYRGSMDMLYEGALLAVLVVWLFLRDWKATLIAASALPLSILPAFGAMAWFGFSLNTLTLLALAVVVGILVDDAIVEIENIERHSRAGKSMRVATEDAVNEIALAVIATTLTLVSVFVPTALMPGIPGLFFKQFGWTVVVAVTASLLVARLLIPMLAARVLTLPPSKAEVKDGPIMRHYLHAVGSCLRRRSITVTAAAAILIASFALVPLIPSGFVPASDEGYTTMSIELPPGSSIEDTLAVAEAARTAVQDVAGIANILTAVGTAQTAGAAMVQAGEVRKANLIFTLTAAGTRPRQQSIERVIRSRMSNVAGARFTQSGGSDHGLSLILTGEDARAVKAAARAIERDLRKVPGLSNVASTAGLERPELTIRPDRIRAAEQGVTNNDIGTTIRIATSGDFESQLAKLNLDNRQVQIRVQVPDATRHDMDAIGNLRVNAKNGPVPLASIASLEVESGPSQLDRYDRHRYVTVSADLEGIPIGTALAAVHTLPSVIAMPSSVKFQTNGDIERMGELTSAFGMALLSALLLILCVLVVLFKDFLQPITILSAIPLAAGGAFIALLVCRSELDVSSMIGLIMLVGIVTKNSILLVEHAIVGMRDRSLSILDAVIDACHKRARPVVMTSVAMIAGMMPIALGLGADASFRQPMAVAVIGGLITSTALSLLVVPVVFAIVHSVEQHIRRLLFRTHARPTVLHGGFG